MTDALFETPLAGCAPVRPASGTTPAAPALGAAGALPVAPDPGDGSGTAVPHEGGEASTGTAVLPPLGLPTGADAGPVGGETAIPIAEPTGPATPHLEIHVVGIPAPQGSKRAFRNPHNDSIQLVESASKKLKPWRQDVKQAALDELAATPGYRPPSDGVDVDITFLLPRPRGHYRTGRNAHLLRDSAPARPTTKPDLDKLLRSTLDALKVAGIYVDDANVVRVLTEKFYAVERTGAVIRIYRTGAR